MAHHQEETTSPPVDDDVEELPTDPAERKRVLNVLAQRRYRRRKKQRQAMLETLVGKTTPAKARGGGPSNATSETAAPSGHQGPASSNGATMSILTFDSAVPSTSGEVDTSMPSLDPPWDEPLDSWLDLSLGPSSNSGTDSSNAASLSDFLQEDDIENCTFSDDFNLAVTELGLLRAGFENASRLNSAERLWDLSASSIFLEKDTAGWTLMLPSNMQPTQKQLTLPHHPIIDILPWPSARNKLIDVYTLPTNFWPKHPEDGATPCSLIRLVYDMEDGGIRVWGADPADEDAWEVSDDFLKAWWWMLDPRILRRTNQRRIARGEPPLRQIDTT